MKVGQLGWGAAVGGLLAYSIFAVVTVSGRHAAEVERPRPEIERRDSIERALRERRREENQRKARLEQLQRDLANAQLRMVVHPTEWEWRLRCDDVLMIWWTDRQERMDAKRILRFSEGEREILGSCPGHKNQWRRRLCPEPTYSSMLGDVTCAPWIEWRKDNKDESLDIALQMAKDLNGGAFSDELLEWAAEIAAKDPSQLTGSDIARGLELAGGRRPIGLSDELLDRMSDLILREGNPAIR